MDQKTPLKANRSPEGQQWEPQRRTSRRSLHALLLLVPAGIVLLLFFLVIEREPLITETPVPTVDAALRAKSLAKNVLATLNSHRETASISASEDELNALMTLAARGTHRLSGRVRMTPGIMVMMVSVRLPSTPAGRFLNIRAEFLPDDEGLNVHRVIVGKLPIPRLLSLPLLRLVLDRGMGNGAGTALLDSVQSLTLTGKAVTLNLRSIPQLKERLKRLHVFLLRLHGVRNGSATVDRTAVSRYYAQLVEADRRMGAIPSPSLAAYLGPLFRLARERSATGDPVRENSAALLALAMYLGDHRFEKLAGLQLGVEIPDYVSSARPVQVGGRQDLRLHFVISAGLKVLTDQGISTAIGEFKELIDAGNGGSGFSFADLAADRAGIRFAEIAADSNGGSRGLQNLLSGDAREELFFPSVADLPENIPKDEFERRYGGANGVAYGRLVETIDRRIDDCPAYGRVEFRGKAATLHP